MIKPLLKGVITALMFSVFVGCENDISVPETTMKENSFEASTLQLYFYQNDSETKIEFETGLKWAFSFLGAELKNGAWKNATTWQSPTLIQLNIGALGFNTNAQEQLKLLIHQFKTSEEYLEKNGIDAGRFVVCILNNSNHYYKIVGMPNALDKYLSDRQFLQKRAAIFESAVALKERLIQLPLSNSSTTRLSYLSEELSGSLKDSSHQVIEREVMDIMANGQLRFGIYDTTGQLLVGSDPNISIGGKPVKCLWCHETNIQPGFAALSSIPGYYSPAQFDSIIGVNKTTLELYRNSLTPENDLINPTNHTKVEKLYLRYMEPSAKRLAAEWGLTAEDVELKLKNIPTHLHPEFPAFGQLYFRNEIEAYSPYATLPSSSSARETNDNEPNLLP